MDCQRMIERLKNAGISFDPGMSRGELDGAELVFQFHFPKEIREFLSCGMPVGPSFFNYRDLSVENVKRFREFQVSIERSFRFDLEQNRDDLFEMLGSKLGFAQDLKGFDEAVMEYLRQSVRLIPFFAHRCFFDGMDGMPVVSFWQAVDVVFYGGTFENYLEHEFLGAARVLENMEGRMKNTGIWADIVC